jgi:hypothetical protein
MWLAFYGRRERVPFGFCGWLFMAGVNACPSAAVQVFCGRRERVSSNAAAGSLWQA